MITLSNADNALKNLYLDVLANQLNHNVGPLWSAIERTSENVTGKKIVKVAPWGLNGGVGAGDEDGTLPIAAENKYLNFELPLVNLYGTLDISDKAERASKQSSGAFLDLLNAEMEGLLSASKFNLGRMLYGDGTGLVATKVDGSYGGYEFYADTTRNLMEGMLVDFYLNTVKDEPMSGTKIVRIDHVEHLVVIDKPLSSTAGFSDMGIYIQGSRDNELIGLDRLAESNIASLYGINRAEHAGLYGYVQKRANNEAFDDTFLARAVDEVNERSGAGISHITCAFDTRRAYQKYLKTASRNTDVLQLEGGFSAISFNGVPMIADRFVADGEMYMIDVNDFKLHQLCDWEWLASNSGKILKQRQGFPTYTATLVKYANLMCMRPNGVAKLTNLC